MAVQLNLDKSSDKGLNFCPTTGFPYYDNAPTNKAISVKQFWGQESTPEIEHPSYSTDLTSNVF
jgi:hypothetical protein